MFNTGLIKAATALLALMARDGVAACGVGCVFLASSVLLAIAGVLATALYLLLCFERRFLAACWKPAPLVLRHLDVSDPAIRMWVRLKIFLADLNRRARCAPAVCRPSEDEIKATFVRTQATIE
jgi:hypothetical protein